jgi:hypothetical protein
VASVAPIGPRFGQPVFVRLCRAGGLFFRFYELGVERHLRAQGACDPAAAYRTGNALARRQRALAIAAEIRATAGEPAGRIGDRAPAGSRIGADFRVICNSDAQQL